MYISLLIVILFIFIFCIVIVAHVFEETVNEIVVKECLPKEVTAIIVLGAGVNSNGIPSVILKHRLDTLIEIYHLYNKSKIILTGDGINDEYNEVKSMEKYIKEKIDINKENIILDIYGVSTYNSIYRAKKIYNIDSAIIITNEFHLSRALYIAKKFDIKVKGISSDKGIYTSLDYYELREIFAIIKDFIKVNIVKK